MNLLGQDKGKANGEWVNLVGGRLPSRHMSTLIHDCLNFYVRSVVKLTGYDADKQEINRPSELLNNVKVRLIS